MWKLIKRLLNRSKGSDKMCASEIDTHLETTLLEGLESMTSLRDLSNLIARLYKQRMTYVDNELPRAAPCPRCDIYVAWTMDLCQLGDYFMSIIDEFEQNRNLCEDWTGTSDDKYSGLTWEGPTAEKYRGLKLKYVQLKNRHRALSEDKQLTLESYATDLSRLCHEKEELKKELTACKRDLKSLNTTIVGKDTRIGELTRELEKLVVEYDTFKTEIRSQFDKLLKQYGRDLARQSKVISQTSLKAKRHRSAARLVQTREYSRSRSASFHHGQGDTRVLYSNETCTVKLRESYL